ncbi:MAG: hypothetical protein IID32_09700, partial [Planctomycetes bacterium]|nr:hypothetical protein [Planctomycetota bacterium]
MKTKIFSCLLFFSTLTASLCPAADLGFTAPQGFEISLYADDDLAHDIYTLTFNAKGQLVVAGRGYVKILHDTDNDGRADKATLFSDWPKAGARGMYFDGNDLICSGDLGLHRIFDRDGDGVADGPSEKWFTISRTGDHTANGIVKGPDGWFYWICGNDAGINPSFANLPGSPVKHPISGALVRVSPDGKQSEILADGFRNPYDLDINRFGNVFTYDADGERVHHLPWYTPTRIFDIAQGMEHGWILKGWVHSWSRPPSNLDNVERLWNIGRGSPTGVVAYSHSAFPEHYQNGLFAICWSLGRVYFFPLNRSGSTYTTQMEIFMETAGDTGFAPTDMAVAPNGDLFISIGGRGTKGSVFRVHYKPNVIARSERSERRGNLNLTPLYRVLSADQPLASWSRAQWVPAAKQLGKSPFQNAVTNNTLTLTQRIRALEILVELFDGVSTDLAKQTLNSNDPELIARAAWALARSRNTKSSQSFLAQMTHKEDPRIARVAWDALANLPSPLTDVDPTPDWLGGFSHP